MLQLVSVLLFAVFAISEQPSASSFNDAQPVCVCIECKENPAIKDARDALLLGEAYARIVFGDKTLSRYRPLKAFRRVRSRGGPFWLVLGSNLKRPESIDGIEVLIDEKLGCLLSVGYSN